MIIRFWVAWESSSLNREARLTSCQTTIPDSWFPRLVFEELSGGVARAQPMEQVVWKEDLVHYALDLVNLDQQPTLAETQLSGL